MIHAYHVIFGAYGFWLPNDPRGSWSDFVGKWELVRFGRTTKSIERRELSRREEWQRRKAKESLKYPPVQFSGRQARAIGTGFAQAAAKSGYSIWACSIMPEHVHLVIARHTYRVESIVRLPKGEATKQLLKEDLHPLAMLAGAEQPPHSPWATGLWKVFLDNEEAIENAIRYVEQNPIKEGKPAQKWNCTTGFRGLEPGWITYH